MQDLWERPWNKTKTYKTYTGNKTRAERERKLGPELGTEPRKNAQRPTLKCAFCSQKNLHANLRPKFGNNLGTEPAKKGVKRGIRADQKAKRVNNLAFANPDCKTSTPGSNPGGASNLS